MDEREPARLWAVSGPVKPSGADPAAGPAPAQPLHHLDALWIQVAGTLCNLSCTHCFVSCGPGVDRHALMSRAAVAGRVREALALGVRELYFTGGEPFLHPELLEILADSLVHAPCTVLTNGTLFTTRRIEALARLAEAARYSLEIRVSLDGPCAADHDRFRGPGSFERSVDGLRRLERAGLLPIVTVTREDDQDPGTVREAYVEALRRAGLERPRLKILPIFRHGREASRTRGYGPAESLHGLDPALLEGVALQCGSGRAVTSRGVFACPLLVDEPAARLGEALDEALGPVPLGHGACFTCWVTGMTCGNA